MLFTRTPGGLSSQKMFYGAEIIAYIEGKTNAANNVVYDNYYYKEIFSEFLPTKKVKIKILGSCNDVLDMYYNIIQHDVPDSFAVIDRDYDGILSTRVKDFRLVYTHGYSWENDFWSQRLCRDLIRNLTMNSIEADREFLASEGYALRRLCYAHRVYLSCRICGVATFSLGKKGGQDGIEISLKKKVIITKNELSMFISKLRTIPDRGSISNFMDSINITPIRSIQGHYWEYVVLQLINCIAKKHSIGKSTAPHETIKGLGLSCFGDSVKKYLTAETYEHYRASLSPFNHGQNIQVKGWIELSKNSDGLFRFILKAGNGEIILTSELYTTKDATENGIAAMRANSSLDERYEKKNTPNGRYYFILKAENHQIIGSSQLYTSEQSRETGIASVKKNGAHQTLKNNT